MIFDPGLGEGDVVTFENGQKGEGGVVQGEVL